MPNDNFYERVVPPTARKLDVLNFIEQRMTIKEIADRLNVSESAVNKHIRTLKHQAGVNSQRDLVSYYQFFSQPFDGERKQESTGDRGCSKTAWRKTELFDDQQISPWPVESDADSMATVHDAQGFAPSGSWSFERELNVGPRVLNGGNAAWVRGAAIAVIVFGMFASIIVALGAAQAISLALDSEPTGSRTE